MWVMSVIKKTQKTNRSSSTGEAPRWHTPQFSVCRDAADINRRICHRWRLSFGKKKKRSDSACICPLNAQCAEEREGEEQTAPPLLTELGRINRLPARKAWGICREGFARASGEHLEDTEWAWGVLFQNVVHLLFVPRPSSSSPWHSSPGKLTGSVRRLLTFWRNTEIQFGICCSCSFFLSSLCRRTSNTSVLTSVNGRDDPRRQNLLAIVSASKVSFTSEKTLMQLWKALAEARIASWAHHLWEKCCPQELWGKACLQQPGHPWGGKHPGQAGGLAGQVAHAGTALGWSCCSSGKVQARRAALSLEVIRAP